MKSIDTLRAEMAASADQARGIQAAADQAGRDPSADEAESITALLNKFDSLQDEVARRERIENATSRLTQPNRVVRPEGAGATVMNAGSYGFKTQDEFLRALVNKTNGQVDARLFNAATYSSEGTNADGGFALPPDFRAGIQSMLGGIVSLLPRLDPIYTTSNAITVPTEEVPPWAASGIQSAVVAEAGTIAETKPVLKQLVVTLAKYGTIVPVTEEMIEDGTGIADFVQRKAGANLVGVLNSAIITAIKGAAAKLTVSKGALGVGAPADLGKFQSMLVALPQEWRGSAVWIMNRAYEATLMNLTIGNFPVYVRANSLAGQPLDSLFGIPVVFSPWASAVGTEGDVILCDPSQFYAVQKTAGVRTDVSPYYAWSQDMTAFRVLVRAAFKCKWAASFTDLGGNTLAPVITLQTR